MSKKLFSKIFVFLLVVGLLFAVAPTRQAQAQTGGDLYVAEWGMPATAYDPETGAPRPMVVHDGTLFHLWYGLGDNSLYHTTSTDPSVFSEGTLTTFKDTSETSYMPYEVASPAIVFEGGTFYMITYKTGTNLVFAIYTSPDGNVWTYKGDVYNGEGLGAQGTDWRKIDSPVLVPDGGTYKLYFQVPPQTGPYKIFMAETGITTLAAIADGDNDIDFSLANSNSAVLTAGLAGEPDDLGVQHPMVVKDNGIYFMWYTGVGSGTYAWRSINFATSSDGITWSRSPANPIIKEKNSHAEATVVKVGDVWHLWHEYDETLVQHVSATGPFEFQTIQAAIDAASAGDTINVAAGTYVEAGQIVIDKNLTIVGEDKTTTIIKPAQNTGSVGDARGWFLVNTGVEFNLSNVTLDGEGKAIYQAIRSNGTGTITNNIIKNMEYTSGSYMGYGVAMMGGDMTISNNTLSNIGRVGIVAFGDGVDNGQITGNTYIGKGDGDYLEYGIEIGGGAKAHIEGNTISNIGDSTTDWSSAAILVTDAYPTNDPASVIITDNTLSNNYQGITVGYKDSDGVIVQAEHNDFSGTRYAINTTDLVQLVDGSPNWFGSVNGPAAGQIIGDVDYSPWCGDADCSFLVYEADTTDATTFQTSITSTPAGGTLYVPSDPPSVTGGYTVGGITLILGDGVVVQNESPCFNIIASYTTITSNGAVCVPTESSNGIDVAGGLTDITIEGLEIDGTGQSTGDGINFAGAVTDVTLRDNFIHNLGGDGVHFTAQPAGYVEIKGNLFMGNTGEGVDNAAGSSDIDAKYNSWGGYLGPKGAGGDDVSANVTYDPWTHVDVYVAAGVGSRYPNEVALGDPTAETITYNVYANLQNAFGAQFTMTFDPEKLQVTGTDTTDTAFPNIWTGSPDEVAPGVDYNNTTGKITFSGGATEAVSGTGKFLFSVTFKGVAPTSALNPLYFDEADEALFGMNPGSIYSSSLNIYAAGMAGVADVNVYDLPTLAISPTATFAKNNEKGFTLTVSNPSTGRAYTNLDVDLSGLTNATLKYYNGSAWVDYTQGTDIVTGPLAVNSTDTVDFKVTFTATTPVTATVTLEDVAIFLVSDTFDFTVLDSYKVTGSVQMQGRTVRSGVSIGLAGITHTEYSYTTISDDFMTGNYTLSDVAEGEYTLTITHDRYLDLVYTPYNLTTNDDLTRLELRGGDVVKTVGSLNVINISDASLIGTNYGSIGGNDADANFDEKVNIFDLAMVGGNYGLQSTDQASATYAYGTWAP